MQGLQTPSSKNRGVGRYTSEIVKEFLNLAKDKHELYLVLNGAFLEECESIIDEFSLIIPRSNIKCWQQYLRPVSGISMNDLNTNLCELIREYFIEGLEPDIVWSTNLQEGWHDDAVTSVKKINTKAFFVTTLHDVIPLMFPQTHLVSTIKPWYQKKIEYTKQSDLILTVSKFSKAKIIEHLGVESANVYVAYNAISNKLFKPKKHPLANDQPYILYVGGGDEHKNIGTLVAAYDILSEKLKKKYKIKFVGKNLHDVVPDLAKKNNINYKNFVFVSDANDSELVSIYQGADLFVYPSRSEGFGIPPLEAMACGVPVISSYAASLPEVIGFKEALFDPENTQELSRLITKVLTNEAFKVRLQQNGLKQAKKFSWHDSAVNILKIFENRFSSKPQSEKKSSDHLYSRLIDQIANIPNIDNSVKLGISKSIAESGFLLEKKATPRIFLDISNLVHFDHATGIQRVVRAVVDGLNRKKSNKFAVMTIFSYAGHQYFYKVKLFGNQYDIPPQDKLNDSIVEFNEGDIILFLDLHPANAISKEKLISRLRCQGARVYFVVYDLLPIEFPNYFEKALSLEFQNWLRVTSKSDGIFCISKDVMNKYKDWSVANNIKLHNSFQLEYFHLGANVSDSMPSLGISGDEARILNSLKNKTIFLMVGTVEPRKGHKYVLDAFEKLWGEGVDITLFIIGKPGWCNENTIERIKKHNKNGTHLFWWWSASDELLELAYDSATCLIAASEGEGFGLPLIEASQHELPIIAHDIPVFREVASKHAYYFKNYSCLADDIKTWLKKFHAAKHPKSKSMHYLTWSQSIDQLLKLIFKNNRQ